MIEYRMKKMMSNKRISETVNVIFDLGIEFYLFVSHGGTSDRGSTCKFVMHEAIFEIYTWILCLSYLHEKQTSRIQSLYLYFIKIVPFRL